MRFGVFKDFQQLLLNRSAMADRQYGRRGNDFPPAPLDVICLVMWQDTAIPERRWLWDHGIPHRAVLIKKTLSK
jgi:hypothetical protein